VVIIDTNSF
jgi:serum/glucocorticoid-regulated kinase 2